MVATAQMKFASIARPSQYSVPFVNTAKIKKGSNSVNTGDRVMVLAFCISHHSLLLVYQVSLNYLQYF